MHAVSDDGRNIQILINLRVDEKGKLHFIEDRYLYGDGEEDNKIFACGLTTSLSSRKTVGRDKFWKYIKKLVQKG